MKTNNKEINKGFTLIELMVATSLFTIIMLMGIGSLVISSNGAKAAQKLRIAVDNVNFAMESMTRELRMGTSYYCDVSSVNMGVESTKDCDPGNVISFTPQDPIGDRVGVYRVAYLLMKRPDELSNTLRRCENTLNTTTCPEIVSSDVNVETLKFYVRGADSSTVNVQPSVKILMNGIVKVKGKEIPFALQSMSSQRSTEIIH